MKTVKYFIATILIIFIIIYCLFYFMIHQDMGILSGNTGFVFVAGSLVVLGYYATKKSKQNPGNNKRNVRTEHGSAHWASKEELVNAGVEIVDDNGNGNIDDSSTFFAWNFRVKNHYHCLTVAPSRFGKGAMVIIPNLLKKPSSSLVVTDPKGELACITARWQQRCNQKVYIIDPWNVQATNGSTHGIKPSGFNPFDFIKYNPDKIIDNCSQISELLVPVNPEAKDPYWDDAARGLIKACMLHIVTYMPESQHNFWTLYKMLRPQGDEWVGMIVDMQLNEAFDGLIGRMSAEYDMSPTEAPLRSVISTAQKATTIFESPELRASLLRSEFNPLNLSDGDCTVYIVIPYDYLQSHARWLRMVVGICIRASTVKVNKKVKFILDEFGVLGKMEEIAKGFQFLAGKNICLWPFVQDLGTLKGLYGEEGMNKFVANASVLQFFNAKDPFTTKYISDLLGKETNIQTSTSASDKPDGGTNTSKSAYGRDLMTAEEIAKDDRTIILYSNLKTIMPKVFYYQTGFQKRADPRPSS